VDVRAGSVEASNKRSAKIAALRAKAKQLKTEGMETYEIAERMGYPVATIRLWIRT
jgi:uncharacterized protein YjcR